MTDNGSAYRSKAFRAAVTAAGTRHKRTRPYTPAPRDSAQATVLLESSDSAGPLSTREIASPLEETGFEPSVPSRRTGASAALMNIVSRPARPTAKRAVGLIVRIRFAPALSLSRSAILRLPPPDVLGEASIAASGGRSRGNGGNTRRSSILLP
jgi:transposase InsO family protein